MLKTLITDTKKTDTKKIKKIITDYEKAVKALPYKANGYALIQEIKKELENETEKTPENLENFFKTFWGSLRIEGCTTFYIANPYDDSGPSLESRTLFAIAKCINVPTLPQEEKKKEKKEGKEDDAHPDTQPNLHAYQRLMPTLENSKRDPKGLLFDDLPDDPKEIIITKKGTYLFHIPTLVDNTISRNFFMNYLDPDFRVGEELGDYEKHQIFYKNKKAYDKIEEILKPGLTSLSPKTFQGLIIITEIALSRSGSSPDPQTRNISRRIKNAMETFPEFAKFMKNHRSWLTEEDARVLVTYAYEYFHLYLNQLGTEKPQEFQLFKNLKLKNGSKNENTTVYDTLYGVWEQDKCISEAGKAIAQCVYESSPPTYPFFNRYFDHHARYNKWQKKGEYNHLVDEKLVGIELTDTLLALDQERKSTAFFHFLYELTGYYPVKNFSWYHLFIPYRQDENTFPWARFLITFFLTFGTAPIVNFLNNLSKVISFSITWAGRQLYEYFCYLGIDKGWAWEIIALLNWIVGNGFKAVGFIISALVSPINTYHEVKTTDKYLGYAFAILMLLVYTTLIVFAGPLLPTLAGPSLVTLFSQLPFVPYIVQLLTPIGTWLTTQFIQPILLAVGIFAFESSLAVTTIITTPILLNALTQFLFDKIKQVVPAPPEVASQAEQQTKDLTTKAATTTLLTLDEEKRLIPESKEAVRNWPTADFDDKYANNSNLLITIKSGPKPTKPTRSSASDSDSDDDDTSPYIDSDDSDNDTSAPYIDSKQTF